VTIGEIIRYRLISPVPEGTSPDFQVVDFLPNGLTFLNDSTAKVAFVSDVSIVSAAVGTSVPAISGCVVAAIPAFNSLPCALANGNVSSSLDINSDPDTFGSGSDIYFRLGNLTNNDSDSGVGTPGIEYVVIEFNALVDNTVAGSNNAGDDRDNSSRTYINNAYSGPISNVVPANIVEPAHNLTKTAAPNSGDAGDTITYLLTYTNNGSATAFDVSLTDTVPGKMTAALGGMIIVNPLACATGQANTSAGNNVNIAFTSVPIGCTVTATYTATLNTTVASGEVLANAVALTYSSLPGTNGTTVNPTGSSTPGVSGADTGERIYTGTTHADVTVNAAVPVKSIIRSANVDTIGSNLTIGEVVTYRLVTDISEGTQLNVRIQDILPAGFTYAGDPRISFIADTDVTEAANLAGADNDALPPTFPVPAARITVTGQLVNFTLGDIINNDTDPNAEQVIIEFDALVNNDTNNNNTNLKNNNFTVTINTGSVDIVSTSNTVTATIVEPFLNAAKTANDSTWIYGQSVTYTLDVTHVASASPAYDIVLTDTIPSGLTFGSVTLLPANWTSSYTAPTLTLSCLSSNGCSLPLAASAQLTFTVTVDSPPSPSALDGSASAVNNVGMTWTSMPGANPDERNGTGTNPPNDYTDTSSHTGGLEYYALGNRVWFDTDNSATINGAEVGVNNVVVNLYAASDLTTILKTNTTINGGYYLFDYLEAGDYVVVIPNSNFTGAGVLAGYWSSSTALGADGALSETAAPDADTIETDSDDNGAQTNFLSTREVRSLPITLGTGNSEPPNETDLNGGSDGAQPDNRANMTVDFGFYKTAIGDLVWLDVTTVDGAYAVGETLVNGAAVSLYSTNGTEIPVGPDGVLGTSDDAAGGVTTNASGIYAFSGLPAGSYVVRAVGPTETLSTVDTSDATDTSNPNTNTNNNDNGVDVLSNSVSANTFNMTPGTSGVVTDNNGTTTNNTIDFGFAYTYALGNRVWFDTDNDSLIDFPSESVDGLNKIGVNGVTVQLYAADTGGNPTGAVLATDTTANGGYYLFDGRFPGNYVVVIPAPNFTGAGVLTGYWSSATTRATNGTISEIAAPDADFGLDGTSGNADDNLDSNDDNGTRQTSGGFNNAVISSAVTLGPVGLTEPTAETDVDAAESGAEHQGLQPDGRANMTVDFGFYKLSVGDQVFSDDNENGSYLAADDAVLPGAIVHLYSADGTTEIPVGTDGILGTSDDGAGGMPTNASGLYRFDGLPAGDYIVRVDAPIGTTSSTIDSFDQTDNDAPNTNTNHNDNGDGISSGTVSSAPVTLAAGSDVTRPNNTVTDNTGTTHNPTLDFGFIPAFSLGNRVWFDTNNDGILDASEVGINGVALEVYEANASGNPTGSALGTATTHANTDLGGGNGYYLFNPLPAGNYVVVVTASNFSGVLNGYWSTGASRADNGGLSETDSADPDNDADASSAASSDDNGMHTTLTGFNGAALSKPVTLGPNPTEPVGETDLETSLLDADNQGQPNNRANMTVDFGFYTINLGSFVWNDADNNGNTNLGTEAGINGVDVELWSADGSTPLDSTTTVGGTYAFDGLAAGNYLVRIPAVEFNTGGTLEDYMSSTGTGLAIPISLGVYEPASDADVNLADEDDNGTESGGTLGAGGYIQTAPVTLTTGAEASSNNANGSTSEPRVDFGVFPLPPTYNHTPLIGIAKNLISSVEVSPGTYQVIYDILVQNMGDTPLDGVNITENLAATFTAPTTAAFVSAASTGTTPLTVNTAYNGSGNMLTGANSLAIGASGTIRLTVNVIPYASGPFNNTAIASGTNPFGGATITDHSQNGTDPDPDSDLDPTNNNDPTPVDFGPAIFDPPIGIKIFNDAGLPLLQWTMTWINSTNIAAVNARVSDPIPAGTTYAIFGAASGYAVPGTAPAGSTNVGVSCTSPSAATTTTLCYYEGPTAANPLGRIVWEGTLGPDFGHTTAETAVNELNIVFHVNVPSGLNAVYNQATIDTDLDGNNTYAANEVVVASSQGIWVRQEEPGGLNGRERRSATRLPSTGFAPNVVTILPKQPADKAYFETGGVQLEIPRLGINTSVTGIPQADDGTWDVSWLWNQTGWLQGTAYPTLTGNSAITGHVYLPSGAPGPFVDIHKLAYGDKIIIHAYGQKYTYEVRENKQIKPTDVSVLKREDKAWVTLITCLGYNEASNTYASRVAVRAALMTVEKETTSAKEK